MFRTLKPKLAAVAVSAWFILVCGMLSWHALEDIRANEASLSWPQVRGKVVRISHAHTQLDDRTWGCPYEIWVRYEYTVGAQRFKSQRVTRSRDFVCADESNLSELLDRYRAGSSVTVSYAPEDPAMGILQPRVRYVYYVGLLLFPISVAIPVLTFLRRWRRRTSGEARGE